jgi:serine/threonine protein kinase
LKFLHEYRVVHLDLKPANILLQKKMMIKVIDFGESYHPDLKHKHNPGFTQPYSAPEIYNCPAHYSSPSDVFSLGVILYEILLSRFPFYLHSDRSKELCYRRGTVFQRWLAAPEDYEMNGDATLLPLLLLLADKCMHPDPASRPQIEWIVIFLRESLEFPI